VATKCRYKLMRRSVLSDWLISPVGGPLCRENMSPVSFHTGGILWATSWKHCGVPTSTQSYNYYEPLNAQTSSREFIVSWPAAADKENSREGLRLNPVQEVASTDYSWFGPSRPGLANICYEFPKWYARRFSWHVAFTAVPVFDHHYYQMLPIENIFL
jgi:hypothetical protein